VGEEDRTEGGRRPTKTLRLVTVPAKKTVGAGLYGEGKEATGARARRRFMTSFRRTGVKGQEDRTKAPKQKVVNPNLVKMKRTGRS